MNLDEYRSFDGLGLAGLVASGAVSPDQLLDCALAALDESRHVNALIDVFEGPARATIREGLPPGPLRGVPFALKNLWTQMAGTVTSNASRLFDGSVATTDSEIVTRFRRSGLVIFAKSNSAELGLSPTTEPALHGATENPWLGGYSAGGSSGGAAAAVAVGILPLAHATDGGGSIRIPASCCGIFGLKPSRGRVPFGPERGEGWGGMSAQHVVSRSVRDSAAALDIISGPMAGDPYAAPPGPDSFLNEVDASPGRLRIGLILAPPGGEPVDPACSAAAISTARRCEDLGHEIVEFTWPFSSDLYSLAGFTVVAPNVVVAVDQRLKELDRELGPDDLEPISGMIYQIGRTSTATDYVAGVQAMHQVGRALGAAFEQIDVLLSPTMACTPLPLGQFSVAGTEAVDAMRAMASFTPVANVTGQPAMSVPLDRSDGLPVGSHFLGRFGDEATLFRLAGQLERAHPWANYLPGT